MTKDQFYKKVNEYKEILLIENNKLKINPIAEEYFKNRINEMKELIETAARMLAVDENDIDYGSVLLTASRMHLKEVQDYLEVQDDNSIAIAVDSLDHIFSFYFKTLDFINNDSVIKNQPKSNKNTINEILFKTLVNKIVIQSINSLENVGGNSEVTIYMLNRFNEIDSYISDALSILAQSGDKIEYGSILLVALKMQYLEMTQVIKESKLNPGATVKFILNYIGAVYFEILFEIKKINN